MIIALGYDDDFDTCTGIRNELVCGQCSASTLLLWQKTAMGDRPKGTSSATVLVDDKGTEKEINYLVRCSFFKFNVVDPEDIFLCEGFKDKV